MCWNTYLEWGEFPSIVKEKKKKSKMITMGSKAAINNSELLILKYMADDDPNLYLDEIALQFAIKTRKYWCHSTILAYLHYILRYNQRVLSDVTKQRNIDQEESFLAGLVGMLLGCPEHLILW